MVSLEKAVIARLSRKGLHFEVFADPEKSMDFKRGKPIPIEDVLAAREIFTDARKGERAPANELDDCFGTQDVMKIAGDIIRSGDIQLTTEQKHKMTEDRRREIADTISRQGMDPKTKTPHPPQRILNAMHDAHVNVDPFKPAKEQIEGVLSKIRGILPISMERLEIAVKVPLRFAGKASAAIRQMAPVLKEEWKPDSWIVLIEIPAGLQGDVYKRLNDLTAGEVEVKIVREKQV